MAETSFDDIAAIGSIADIPSYQLPPEAWSLALNMRAKDRGLESMLGWSEVFGVPLFPPHFIMQLSTASDVYWLYTSLTKAAVYDGTTHTDITRLAGDYTAAATEQWNGTLLGGVPILNNGSDVPQFWSPTTIATKLANLTNWPSTKRARVIRAFGPFLVMFNITDSGTSKPHLVQWSHPADPGSVPTSYDPADQTKDTGEKDLTDVNAGLIQDALPLGGTMFVYKESSTWKMRFIGGRFVMDFGQSAWLTSSGILAPRCAIVTGDGLRQVVVTQDDVIWHNGTEVRSILNQRQRARLFNEIDPSNFGTSFLVSNPNNGEVIFNYPGPGKTQPDRSIIMNYKEREGWVVTEGDGVTYRNHAIGTIESPNEEIWDFGTDAWDEDTGPWSEIQRRRVIVVDPVGPSEGNDSFTKFLLHLDNNLTDSAVGQTPTHTWTLNGSAPFDGANKKFGTHAIAPAGAGFISTPDSADFTLAGLDWCFDIWGRPGAFGANRVFGGQSDAAIANASLTSIAMRCNSSGILQGFVSNGTSIITLTGTTVIPTNAFHHAALCRDGGTIKLFYNGALEASASFSGNVNDSSVAWEIGATGDAGQYFGQLDEARLSVGKSRLLNPGDTTFPIATSEYTTSKGRFYLFDSGTTRAGVGFSRVLQREGLAVLGRKKNGDWINDPSVVKVGKRIRPKIRAGGGPVNVRIGAADFVDGATRWSTSIPYTPGVMQTVDPIPVSGRALAVEFSSDKSFRIDGYMFDIEEVGSF